jgi:iron complex outermembrane receptor protein
MRTTHTRRARLLTGGAAFALGLALAGVANAQSADQDPEVTEVEEIIVTGIRASIESSIAEKRRSTSIVEVVTAEDIGKLPDVSIAESLARLPGLTSQRLDGRSQVISVRGLGPDFTTALLNGREQVTSGDNRGVEFDQYPSELLSGVTVYKTPDASLVGQGLAGTVDLRTVRPLEYGREALAANYRYEINDKGALNAGTDDAGHRFSVSYIDQFADDTVGVAFGFAHTGSPYQAEQFRAWGPPYPNGPGGDLVLGGAEFRVMSGDLQRDAFMGALEFRPNERSRTVVDAYHSTFDNTQVLRGLEAPLWWGGSSGACPGPVATCRPGPQLQPGYTVEDGLITEGAFSNVKAIVQNYGYFRETELWALGFNTQYDLTDTITIEADVAWSKGERQDELIETTAGTGRNIAGALDTLGFRIQPDGAPRFTNQLNYADPSLILLTSPQGWGGVANGQDGYLNRPAIDDELLSLKLGSRFEEMDLGFINAIEVGVYATEREKSFTNEQYYLTLQASPGSVPVPTQFLLEPTSLDYVGITGGVLSYDVRGLLDSGIYNRVANLDPGVVAGSWLVNEKVLNGYVQADIDTTLMGVPVTGNFGVQIVHTDQSSDGFAANGATVTAITGGDAYTELYPSVNLIFQPWDDHVFRVAAARTFARPRMDEMRASQTYGVNFANENSTDPTQPFFGGGGGNPNLRPWIANVFDVSYERYFGRSAYFSIAAFYKDLESYIYNQNVLFDFTGFPTQGGNPASFIGSYNSPQNGDGGYIQGVEFAISTPFDMFWPALEGFGGSFSISSTESDIQPDPGNPSQPIPGLSEVVANTTIYYEKDGFQARVSNRYRSEFTGEVSGFGNSRTFRQVGDESVVDAQIGYQFQTGPLEGLSFLAQVNNLTDEEFTTNVNGDERQTINYQSYGRTFLFGVNYRY